MREVEALCRSCQEFARTAGYICRAHELDGAIAEWKGEQQRRRDWAGVYDR